MDLESRKINYDTEWKLNTELLQQALQILGVNPDLDLFASRINTQLSSYVSFKPDPGAKAVQSVMLSLQLSWHDTRFYAFPPFCVIPKVLQNICTDGKSRCRSGTRLAKSTMVSTDSKDADKLPSASISEEESVKSTTKPNRGTSTSETNYLRTIRSRFRCTGFSKQATDILENRDPKDICLLCGKVAQVCAQQTH